MVAVTCDFKDRRSRSPGSFLHTAQDNGTVGRNSDPVGIAKTVPQRFNRAGGVHASNSEVSGRNRPVQATSLILLQRSAKVMTTGCRERIRHAFIEVRFMIAVEVVQSSNLVGSQNQNLVILNDNPECLIKTGGDSLPAQRFCCHRIDAIDKPNFAHQRRHDNSAVCQTSHATNSHC